MEFDQQAFARASFSPRTEVVKVPELVHFFRGDGDPAWTVRGLTGEELYRVKAAAETGATMRAMVEALSAGAGRERVAAIRSAFGLDESTTPEEYAKRIEMLLLASVSPRVDRPTVVKLIAAFPATVATLTDAILRLTGLGQQPGKSSGSGETPASATP